MTVSLTVNKYGEVIQNLLSLDRPLNPAPPEASEPEDAEMRVVVTFFNFIRGFGFVPAKDIIEDVCIRGCPMNMHFTR